MRLSKSIRDALLAQNEGFKDRTHFDSKNHSETNDYEIRGGALHVRSSGRTSWADSSYDNEYVADDAATHRFLKKHLPSLTKDGLE